MRAKITSFIMILISMLMLMVLGIFGIIIYEEFVKTGDAEDVKNFVSNIVMVGEEPKEVDLTPQILNIDTEEKTTTSSSKQTSEKISDKYLYNQLDEYSKIIYKALYDNKENMKIGNYEINIGTEINPLLSQDNGNELLGQCFQSAIEAYTYDNPDVFYIEFSKLYLNIETTTKGNKKTYKVSINSGNSTDYLTKEFSSKERIDSAINEIEKVRNYFVSNQTSDTYGNIKMVHDYLVDNLEYDQSVALPNIYDLYGALVNKKCVCEGYAKAFKYLMDSMNIPCVIISGEATNSEGHTERHAWNYVQLNQNWYAMDCTWDDPIIVGTGRLSNSSKYKYFLKGESEFNKSHIPQGQFAEGGKVFEYPSLSSNNY